MKFEIIPTDDDADFIDLAYPGGVLPNPIEVASNAIKIAANMIAFAANWRIESSMSGAMRWPWSDEAALDMTGKVNLRHITKELK